MRVRRFLSLSAAIVTQLVTRRRMASTLAVWMQTTGTRLLVVNRCSPACVRMPAQDSRSARGLLYFAAVRLSVWKLDRHALAITGRYWFNSDH